MIAIPALRGGIGVPGLRIKTRMKQVRYHCAQNPIFADKSGPKWAFRQVPPEYFFPLDSV